MIAVRTRAALGALALGWSLAALAAQQDPAAPASAPAAAASAAASPQAEHSSFFDRLKSRLHAPRQPQAAPAASSGSAAVAPELASESTPAAAASAPTRSGAGAFFHRLTPKLLAPWHHAPAASAAAPAAGTAMDVELSRHTGVRVVDITTVSNRADNVVDPACKVLVQPFGSMGSTMSLTAFAAKVELMHKLGMGGSNDIHEVVRRAALQLNWLPASIEKQIGEHLLERGRAQILPRDRGRVGRIAYEHAEQTLAAVLAQVQAPLPYTFRIYVLKEAQGNASSLPGGTVLVDENVVDRHWDPDVAFFKIAHEVSHVLQRHETHAYQAALVDGVQSLTDLRTLISHSSQRSVASVTGQLWGFKSLVINFSSQQELQADACAVRLMRQHYTEKPQLVQALSGVLASFPPAIDGSQQTMQPKDLLGVLKFLTNGIYERHPDTQERRQNIVHVLGQAQS